MKALLAALTVLTLGMEAHAQQTADCAGNMRDMKNLIERKFSDVMEPSYINRFKGTWVHSQDENMSFSIGESTRFSANGYSISICPQSDRSFYVFVNLDRSHAGTFRYSGGNVSFKFGTGEMKKANGTFVKKKGSGNA